MKLSTVTRQSYSEVNGIINLLDKREREKIPVKLREYFEKEKDIKYTKEIDASIPLKEQGLKRETIAIMAMLNLNYICDDENEKRILKEKYEKNEAIYQKELSEKYNIDNIFKNVNVEAIEEIEKNEEEQALIVKKESFINKFLNFIKRIFKK